MNLIMPPIIQIKFQFNILQGIANSIQIPAPELWTGQL